MNISSFTFTGLLTATSLTWPIHLQVLQYNNWVYSIIILSTNKIIYIFKDHKI
jgi:hypothetical protein